MQPLDVSPVKKDGKREEEVYHKVIEILIN